MLFNSYIFIFLFLPVTLLGYTLLGKNRTLVIYWLTLASWVFYSFWNPVYFPLLLGSIIVNFGLGKLIARRNSKMILIWGIGLNLALIAYYKYSGFFLSMAIPNDSPAFSLASTILPLGISFFTFQQIAYLVDTYKKQTVKHSFSEYALFVSFFPQLIAGPIVQQKDVLPQFHRNKFKLSQRLLFFGLSYFILGLFKKVAVADTFGQFASPLFVQAGAGEALGFIEAWSAALAYTFQLYFDFSAYSDMAIGLALMFGIKLPLNFYSPYKALNISDFWRRWHITLSHFLRD
ncbi:MAG: MBOAT family protein, partial [Alphaproteobacteria bacterium]|nr:MBOAT family protein [Alphaproteobacteria bacterium]